MYAIRSYYECIQKPTMDKKINIKFHNEPELDKAEKRFQAICEITSDWIWEVDEKGLYRNNFV